MADVINWFEIPVSDFERAAKFYSTILGGEIHEMKMNGPRFGFLPMEGDGVGGAIAYGEGYVPTEEGALVYLSGGDDLSVPLSKVSGAGGKVLMPKTLITEEIGYMALFRDTEGNRVAFHSPH